MTSPPRSPIPDGLNWRCAPDCDRVHYSRGLCQSHFHKVILGAPGARDIVDGLPRHVWDRVDKTGACWLWTGPLTKLGYTQGSEHRLTCAAVNGPIPDGWQVDHTCHSDSDCRLGAQCPHRRCVNPAHLEAVPGAVNTARARKRMCGANLHEMTPDNLYVRPAGGGHWCRACRRLRDNARRDRRCRACGAVKVDPTPRSVWCNDCLPIWRAAA